MAYSKLYTRINWKNKNVSTETPLSAANLNKIDYAVNEIDNRVMEQETIKLDKATALTMVKDWSINEKTGIITITKLNGEKILFDLNIEKIPVAFALSENGILTMTTDDGTEFTADIGSMIPVLTFNSSDTITVSVTGTGVNRTYSFSIKDGSVTEEKLQPGYLADIRVQAAAAESAKDAAESAKDAAGEIATAADAYAKSAKSYAVGGTGTRAGEDTDNAKFYAEQAKIVSGDVYGNILNTVGEVRDNNSPNKFVGALAFKEYLDGTGVPLAEPTGVTLKNNDEAVTICWTDPDDIINGVETLAEWEGTLLVRKAGAPPQNKNDGVIVLDSKTKNQHKTSGFADNGLTNGQTYHYGIFPYTTLKTYNYSCVKNITPAIIYPSAVTSVAVRRENQKLTITFSKDSTVSSVKCVYKAGSAPENSSDGTVITNFTSGSSIANLINNTTYYFKLFSYNEKGREKASAVYSGTPNTVKIVTWADGTYAEIADMLEAHYANKINIANYWSVGDVRTIRLAAMGAWKVGTINNTNGETHEAQDVQIQIIGMEHDNLVTPINGHVKAAITVDMKDILKEKGAYDFEYTLCDKNKIDFIKSWNGCHRRKNWINTIFKNALPTELKTMIKTVKKITYAVSAIYYNGLPHSITLNLETSHDDCFLLSKKEATTETIEAREEYYDKEGKTYELYATESSRIKKDPSTNIKCNWWLRTPSLNSEYFKGVLMINSFGDIGANDANAINGISVAFSL